MSDTLAAAPSDPVIARPNSVFYDGSSSRRRNVTLFFAEELRIAAEEGELARWPYADIRRSDSPAGTLRLSCITGPPLARLEIRDLALAAALTARCGNLDAFRIDRRGVARIVAWSLAAAASIVAVVLFGLPLAADRLAPLVPASLERRLGDATDLEVRSIFGRRSCDNPAGQQAFTKLVARLREASGIKTALPAAVLPSPIANAFALPGGRIYLLDGLLSKATQPDEIAGVLAHELGHVQHRDVMRSVIYNGGTSFLIGLLFGDVTGSGAAIFAARSVVEASYSREAEANADGFAIETMHALGRSPLPMAELLFRITGKEGGSGFNILASHPLTEDRLARMKEADRPATGAPLLDDKEWHALKQICKEAKKT